MFIYSAFITTFQKSNTVVFLLSPSDIVLNIFSGNDRESKSGIVFIISITADEYTYPSQAYFEEIGIMHSFKASAVPVYLMSIILFLLIDV